MDIKTRGIRNHEPRALKYWPQVKFACYALRGLWIFSLIVSLSSLYDFFDNKSHTDNDIFDLVMFFSLTAFYIFWDLKVLSPMSKSIFQAFEDKLLITIGKKKIIFPYKDIKKVETKIIGSYAGYFKIKLKDGRTKKITVVLDRSEYILEAIYKARPELINEEKYIKLRKNLVIASHRLSKFYNQLTPSHFMFNFLILASAPIFSIVLYFYQSKQFVIYEPLIQYIISVSMMIFILAGIIYFAINYVPNYLAMKNMSDQLDRNPNNKKRNIKKEKLLLNISNVSNIVALAVVFTLFFKFDLNTIGSTQIRVTDNTLNLIKGEKYWQDTRYRCTDCNYSLKKDDLVALKNDLDFGKVVGLPGDQVKRNVMLKKDKQQGRYIASVTENKDLVVPEGSVAIQLSENKGIAVISAKGLVGKMTKEINHFK